AVRSNQQIFGSVSFGDASAGRRDQKRSTVMKRRGFLLFGLSLLACMALAARPHVAAAASWQTSAPRDGVYRSDGAELGLRNKYGAPGECYTVLAEVYDPYGSPEAYQYKSLCGDDWTYWYFQDANYRGWYSVTFAI